MLDVSVAVDIVSVVDVTVIETGIKVVKVLVSVPEVKVTTTAVVEIETYVVVSVAEVRLPAEVIAKLDEGGAADVAGGDPADVEGVSETVGYG